MKHTVWILLLMIIACRNEPVQDSAVPASRSGGELMADTITYDVIIRNIDPDDIWTAENLRKLDRQKFVDSIFSLVYQKKAVAIDYNSDKALDLKELKRREEAGEFTRESIGKIQFTERWYFDNDRSKMTKEILSLVLGYEFYVDSGEFRGYKPVFKVLLNP